MLLSGKGAIVIGLHIQDLLLACFKWISQKTEQASWLEQHSIHVACYIKQQWNYPPKLDWLELSLLPHLWSCCHKPALCHTNLMTPTAVPKSQLHPNAEVPDDQAYQMHCSEARTKKAKGDSVTASTCSKSYVQELADFCHCASTGRVKQSFWKVFKAILGVALAILSVYQISRSFNVTGETDIRADSCV